MARKRKTADRGVSILTLPTPGTITGLAATPAPDSVALTWDADVNSLFYEVWVSRSEGSGYVRHGVSATNEYTHEQLTENQLLWYKVRGGNGEETGVYSDAVQVTTTKADLSLVRARMNRDGDILFLEWDAPILPAVGTIAGISVVKDTEADDETLEVEYTARLGSQGRATRVVEVRFSPAQPAVEGEGGSLRIKASYAE